MLFLFYENTFHSTFPRVKSFSRQNVVDDVDLQSNIPIKSICRFATKYKCALSFSQENFQFQVSSGRKLLQTKSIQTFAISRSPAGQQLPFFK